MNKKIVKFSEFRDELRISVLAAADKHMETVLLGLANAGWKDTDLKGLFAAVDSHALILAKRINGGELPNSGLISIDMDE